MLIGKKVHEQEYVNDINYFAINFFRVLVSNPYELWDAIGEVIKGMNAEKFNELRFNAPEPTIDPLAAAAWYYAINKFARNGIVRFRKSDGKCNSTYCKVNTGRGLMTWDWMMEVRDRLDGVNLWSAPYQVLLTRVHNDSKIDIERTIVVADPPYSQVFTKYDQIDFKDSDHIALANRLGDADCYWLLTINDNKFIRKLYKSFYIKDVQCYWQCSNSPAGRGYRRELIVTNYPLRD